MIRRPPRSTLSSSSAASDVYKRQGEGSLATDLMACSVAVHALKQCDTRKSINHSYSAAQICQHVRSYLLSQIVFEPAQRHAYRQVRIFAGHIVVAAYHLGWDIQVSHDGQCYFTISSRCGLLTRYANMQDYYTVSYTHLRAHET